MNPGLDDNEYGDDDDEGQIMKRGPDDREKKNWDILTKFPDFSRFSRFSLTKKKFPGFSRFSQVFQVFQTPKNHDFITLHFIN